MDWIFFISLAIMYRIENYYKKAQSKEESKPKEWLSEGLPKKPTM